MRQLVVAALALAACRDTSGTPPARGSAGSATVGSAGPGPGAGSGTGAGAAAGSGSAAVDPWAAQAAAKPPDTPETRKLRAEAALGRVATIVPTVAKLRGLSFRREVPTRYQTTPEFQAFVRREIAKERPAERTKNLAAALAHLGLLVEPIDIAAVEEQAMVTQAGAYYDPAAKAFFLVMVPDNELMLDTISAHELTHALQDQHFDLTRYLPASGTLDEDAATARRFVVEGDATFTMLLFALHAVVGDALTPAAMTGIRGQVEAFAAQDLEGLKAQVKGQSAAFGGMDGEIKKSIDAMDSIPPAVLVPLLDAYMKGALVALIAYEHGGWPAVDALYRRPPTSTEQVLHPATKLIPRRDEPRRVVLARPTDPELAGNVLGELSWKIYFELWKTPGAAAAAAGWGGDRYSVTRRKDGRLVAQIATVWDTAADAAQFEAAYRASLATRFSGAPATASGAVAAERPGGGKIFLRTIGTRVFIVDGADDARALDALIRTTKAS
jgi:hypothetical protein